MKIYNEDKPSKRIIVIDEYNFYRSAMTQYYPTDRFKWLTQDKIKKLDVNTIQSDNPDGWILQIDLEYSENLHNNYPPSPEKIETEETMLSSYFKKKKVNTISQLAVSRNVYQICAVKTKYVLHCRYYSYIYS